MSVFGIIIVAAFIIIIVSILSTLPVTQETDAVTKQHTKKTVCIDGVCTTNETVIGDCPPLQCSSENSITIK
jgi:hypothetical protein